VRATLQSGEFEKQDHLIERLLEEGFASTDIASALFHSSTSRENAPASKTAREEMGDGRESPPFRIEAGSATTGRPAEDLMGLVTPRGNRGVHAKVRAQPVRFRMFAPNRHGQRTVAPVKKLAPAPGPDRETAPGSGRFC